MDFIYVKKGDSRLSQAYDTSYFSHHQHEHRWKTLSRRVMEEFFSNQCFLQSKSFGVPETKYAFSWAPAGYKISEAY